MYFSNAILAATTSGLVAAAPFSYPLANGFPNLNSTALQQVYKLAGGTLPNGPLPTSLTAAATAALQLIAANELFEVAYFSELLANVTNKVTGYEAASVDTLLIESLTAIVNVGIFQMATED